MTTTDIPDAITEALQSLMVRSFTDGAVANVAPSDATYAAKRALLAAITHALATARAEERAAVVAWLRAEAVEGAEVGGSFEMVIVESLGEAADRIQRGDHLKPGASR